MADMDPFEIETVEIAGVPTRVWKHAPPSLRVIWDASAAFGSNEYLVYRDERITFDQAHQMVRALAHRLDASCGVAPGDRVAIATRNYPEWVIAFWAAVSIGAVVVPLNAWWTGPELAYGLRDSGAVVLFADDERIERLQPHLGTTGVKTVVAIRSDREGLPWQDAISGEAPPLPEVGISPDDDVTIMYTSGTTGKPKGAVATHRNACNFLYNGAYRAAIAAMEAAQQAPTAQPAPDSQPAPTAQPAPAPLPMATLLTFPLFHVGGLQSFLLPFTAAGGKIVLMYKWDPVEAAEIVERESITTIAGVPTTLFELLDEAKRQGKSLSSLAGVSAGATLVPPELVRRIDDQFASRAAPGNGYGLTETSGAAVANFGGEYVSNPESVGKPIAPVMEMKIVTADGTDAGTDEVGEIWLKGPTVVRGYFGLPKETAEAFTDGWFHTGDLGRIDADGNLYVVDRMKDMIVRGGENIYAAEIEAALFEHPDIVEAAMIGIPDQRLGEEVGVIVRVRDGADLSEQGVKDHLAGRLAAFKVPAQVWFSDDALPRNAAGKVLKRELREKLLKGGR